MTEAAILSALTAKGHQERASAIERLRSGVKQDGRLRFKSLEKLFAVLADLLHDSNWNLRRDTLLLITEAIPKSARDVGQYVTLILPGLINNLGDSKVAIRRGAAAAIKTSLEHRSSDCQFAPVLVVEGIENPETRIRLETLKCLESGVVWDAATDDDLLLLVEATSGRLRDVDSGVVEGASVVLQALPDIIGAESFTACINSLDDGLRDLYDRLVDNSPERASSSMSSASRSEKLAFGFITPMLLDELQSDDWEARGVAVEELELTVARLERTSSVIPHIQALIVFLASLFGDANMKVSIGSLEVMGQLVQKVGWPMRSYLNQIMGHLVDLLADTRVLLRQALTKLISRLMHCLTPTPVLDLLLERLTSDNWRIREEIVQILILSLGQFTRNQFDFKRIIDGLHPLLLDPKKRVKCVTVAAFTSIQQLVGDDTFDAYLDQCDDIDGVSISEELAHLRANMAQSKPNFASARSALASAGGLGLQRSDSGDSLSSSVSSRNPRPAAKLPWSSLPSSAASHGADTGHDNRRTRRVTGESRSADRHKTPSSARQQEGSPRLNDRVGTAASDTYVPSFADEASPRRERRLSASESPFPVAAKVARSGSLRRHGSGKVRDTSADYSSRHNGSDRSGIPAPVRHSGPAPDSATSRAAAASLATRASTPGYSSRLNRSRSNLESSQQISAVHMRDSPDSDDAALSRSNDSSRANSRTTAGSRPSSALSRADSEDASLGDSTVPTALVRSPALRIERDDGGMSPDSVFDASDDSESAAPIRVKPLTSSPSPMNRASRVDLMSPSEFEAVPTIDFSAKNDQVQKLSTSPSPSQSPDQLSDYEAELLARAKAGPARMAHSPSPTRRTPSTVNIGESAAFSTPPKNVKHNYLKARSNARAKPKPSPAKSPMVEKSRRVAAKNEDRDGEGLGRSSPMAKPPVARSPPTVRKGLPASRKPAASPRLARKPPARSPAASPKIPKQQGRHPEPKFSGEDPEHHSPKLGGDSYTHDNDDEGRSSPPRRQQKDNGRSANLNADGSASAPAASGSGPRPPAHPPGSGKRGKGIRRGSGTRGTVRTATAEAYLIPLSDIEPHPSPQTALKDALAALKRGVTQETWSDACEGLTIFRQLLQHSVEIVLGSLPVVTKAIAGEVICLRSITARLAILVVGDLMETLGKSMDKELDLVISHLAKKIAGDGGSGFIRDEIDATLGRIRNSGVSKLKLLSAFVPHHVNKASGVRIMVIENINELIPITKTKIFTFKDADRVMISVSKLCEDSDPRIRYNARKAFYLLSPLNGFDNALHALSGRSLSTAMDVIDKLKKNGLGDPPASNKPNRMISASMRDDSNHGSPGRTAAKSQGGSRGPSARAPAASRGGTGHAGNSIKRRSRSGSFSGASPSTTVPLTEALREELDALVRDLAATDWKARDAALDAVEDLVCRSGPKLGAGLTKLFDVFTLRLTDSNSKVNKHALEICVKILPQLAEPLSSQAPILVQLIDKLAPNLASKNRQIRDLSLGALDVMAKSFDSVTLLQPLVNAANFGSAKVMEAMVVFIAGIVGSVLDVNAKFATRQLMPLLGRLLGDAKHKADCTVLCKALLDCLGDAGLRDAAGLLPPDKQKLLATAIKSC